MSVHLNEAQKVWDSAAGGEEDCPSARKAPAAGAQSLHQYKSAQADIADFEFFKGGARYMGL